MAAMASLSSVFLLSCLALTVQSQTCDRLPCLPSLNGTCIDGQCQCPGNQIGDGSLDCVDPDVGCLCMIKGDPHITTFQGSHFTFPFVCGHSITEFVTTQLCRIDVGGLASYIATNSRPLTAFEDRVDVTVQMYSDTYSVIFYKGQNPVIVSNTFTGMTADFSGDVKVITGCGVTIKYDTKNARFSISTAEKPLLHYGGICQECNPGEYNPSRLNRLDALEIQISNITQTSVTGTPWGHPSACDDLASAASNCGARQSAEQICGSLYTNGVVLNCLVGKESDPEQLLKNFRDCFRTTCRARGTPLCSSFTPYFLGCDMSTVAALSDPSLCSTPAPPTRPPRGVAPPGGSGGSQGSWSGVNIDRFNP